MTHATARGAACQISEKFHDSTLAPRGDIAHIPVSLTDEPPKDPGSAPGLYCAACGRAVQVLTAVEAARLLPARGESLGKLLESGAVHAIPTASGPHLICRDSVFGRDS